MKEHNDDPTPFVWTKTGRCHPRQARSSSCTYRFRVIEANRDLIAGVKVRVGRNAGGASGVGPLDVALGVAEETHGVTGETVSRVNLFDEPGYVIAGELTLGVPHGIVLGVALSLLMLIYRTSHPDGAVLGQLPGTEAYRDIRRHPSGRRTIFYRLARA